MAAKYTKPRGTQDILPGETWKWDYMEAGIRKVMGRYGYKEIRLPTFENTEVFSRGMGDSSDVVTKEMYTFNDKSGRSVTLRPEGTAGVVRATLENGLLAASPLPVKLFYIQSCFRYEKMQKGRWREFHQAGIECFGTNEPDADVESIQVASALLEEFGVRKDVMLEINSIGCPTCRPAYHKKLNSYLNKHRDELCPTCRNRMETNPLRILDCKEPGCQEVLQDAPVMLDFLCDDCETHFNTVKSLLDAAGTQFRVNPMIVRGLDYYSNTVFEFVAEGVGTQGTVCGGGRYNGLIEELGGQATPAVGFAMGMERLLMALEEHKALPAAPEGPALYAVGIGTGGRAAARWLVNEMRQRGIRAEYDLVNRSVKAQMKAADRLGAKYTVVIGDDEAASGNAMLKNMRTGAEREIQLVNGVEALNEAEIAITIGDIEGSVDDLNKSLLGAIDNLL